MELAEHIPLLLRSQNGVSQEQYDLLCLILLYMALISSIILMEKINQFQEFLFQRSIRVR